MKNKKKKIKNNNLKLISNMKFNKKLNINHDIMNKSSIFSNKFCNLS